ERKNESYGGGLRNVEPLRVPAPATAPEPGEAAATPRPDPSKLGFCKHKIFGMGKIIAQPEPNKFKVNFPGFGIKTIVRDYLELL
ncbi:MAG: ATP-dependent helicase, partial [Pseudodesulfovibrio sp.]